ncbi:GNAT family N-acetyltransferase [Chryseobacterium sp. SIMBA_038]|uniref:GNAT family N-acetyltransferase n=1 Tax=Chryseobacterium sp. SIMBA_038 TaxID=3085780 RepID=UPI00397AC91C
MQIKEIKTELEIQKCWEVISLLRPHLDKNNWLEIILEMMKNEKYSIAAIEDNDKFVAFAGHRIMNSLHSGRIIYIDDLCTLESHRGKGLATQLLDYIEDISRKMNLDAVVLDTDFHNHTAQKVYFKSGFKLVAVHLANRLKK